MVHQYNRDAFVNVSYTPCALARDEAATESYAGEPVGGMLGAASAWISSAAS